MRRPPWGPSRPPLAPFGQSGQPLTSGRPLNRIAPQTPASNHMHQLLPESASKRDCLLLAARPRRKSLLSDGKGDKNKRSPAIHSLPLISHTIMQSLFHLRPADDMEKAHHGVTTPSPCSQLSKLLAAPSYQILLSTAEEGRPPPLVPAPTPLSCRGFVTTCRA